MKLGWNWVRKLFQGDQLQPERPKAVRLTLEQLEARLAPATNITWVLGPVVADLHPLTPGQQLPPQTEVARFLADTNGAPDTTPSDFQAVIHWGDGTSSPGVVAPFVQGGYTYPDLLVEGSHSYARAGSYNITVDLTPADSYSENNAVVNTALVTAPPPAQGAGGALGDALGAVTDGIVGAVGDAANDPGAVADPGQTDAPAASEAPIDAPTADPLPTVDASQTNGSPTDPSLAANGSLGDAAGPTNNAFPATDASPITGTTTDPNAAPATNDSPATIDAAQTIGAATQDGITTPSTPADNQNVLNQSDQNLAGQNPSSVQQPSETGAASSTPEQGTNPGTGASLGVDGTAQPPSNHGPDAGNTVGQGDGLQQPGGALPGNSAGQPDAASGDYFNSNSQPASGQQTTSGAESGSTTDGGTGQPAVFVTAPINSGTSTPLSGNVQENVAGTATPTSGAPTGTTTVAAGEAENAPVTNQQSGSKTGAEGEPSISQVSPGKYQAQAGKLDPGVLISGGISRNGVQNNIPQGRAGVQPNTQQTNSSGNAGTPTTDTGAGSNNKTTNNENTTQPGQIQKSVVPGSGGAAGTSDNIPKGQQSPANDQPKTLLGKIAKAVNDGIDHLPGVPAALHQIDKTLQAEANRQEEYWTEPHGGLRNIIDTVGQELGGKVIGGGIQAAKQALGPLVAKIAEEGLNHLPIGSGGVPTGGVPVGNALQGAMAPVIPLGKKLQGGVAQAVEQAQKSGLLQGINPGKAAVGLQTHNSASIVRKILNVAGGKVQSAHIAPTSILKNLPGYNRGQALTTLLPTKVHQALDNQWKAWAKQLRLQGKTEITAKELYDEMAKSIENTPGLTPETKGALKWRMFEELYKDFKLQPDTKLPLPYPNIKPPSP
jgi:hypothetical protein